MFKKVSKRFCAKIVGFVFFIAGILKLMDPVGTTLIVKEYMNFLHLGFLRGIAGVSGELFALAETFCGICLVTGVFRKITAWTSTILLGGFTLLTLVLWIFNPTMDCGCFGEAIHLTHFQSFAKNIVLCGLVLAAFLPYKDFGTPSKKKYLTFGLIGTASLAFAIYSLIYIPLLELTPFNLSSRLAVSAEEPANNTDDYISTFIYEKNGKQGVFTLNHLPDSTWTYVETRTIKKEDNIPESDYPELTFRDAEGNYRDSLAAQGNVMVFSVTRPDKMKDKRWTAMAETCKTASETGFNVLVIVAGTPGQVVGKLPEQNIYFADYRTIVSLNRSNGGAVYFNDGNLISKWSASSYPSEKDFKRMLRQDSTEVMLKADSRGKLTFQAFMLYTLSILLLI